MADELETESAVTLLQFKNGNKMTNEPSIKQELLDEEDDEMDVDEDDMNTLGPAALGLQRVGTQAPPKPPPSQPAQVLNARGMPARIRKKNKLFFDDDIVNTPHHRVPSAKKQKQTPTPSKKSRSVYTPLKSKESPRYTPNKKSKTRADSPAPPLHSTDRKVGQKVGLRLRNLLKLPKAHKWVCYEWFYSNVDKCLFSGDNDFSICLKESFPELKTRDLTRIEWTKIRRMMGKPRRCSPGFFHEERVELEKKRKKIRALQQRKATDMASFKDLPAEVPMQLVIGTKVTARLRKPQDGLFTGSIDAVDTSNNTYRITFERQGLGTHSVPDYEVLSNEPPETITLSSFTNKFRPRNGSYYSPIKNLVLNNTLKIKKDPLISGSMINKPHFVANSDGKIGGFPAKLLEKMVLVTKILRVKKEKIKAVRCLNSEAEKLKSFEQEISEDFERRYAALLIDLEKLNHDLQMYLGEMQVYCRDIAPEPSVAAMLAPSILREKCHEEAQEIVDRNNYAIAPDKEPIKNDVILNLVTDLTALMLQVKSLADSDQNAYELQVLQGTMEGIKRTLSNRNQQVFQRSVEVHMKHIEVGLGQASQNKSAASSAAKI